MICAIDGCERRRKYRELCGTHYERQRVTGSTELTKRPPSVCSVAGCDEPALARSLCQLHYQRMTRLGTTELTVTPLRERLLLNRVIDAAGCWLWQGQPGVNGYGRISVNDVVQYAHRVSYETFVGPIPADLTIDHLCRVRMCINPAHLEPVTRDENTRRELQVRYA